ncbi:MAG: HAD family hydrolase [Cyanobacteriota bacterium]|nr:HAD family hydrolase [Cyanobacteriota bacterium]
MNYATQPLARRIAVVFDFDETLIPDDSFKILLKDCQLDVDAFKRDRVEPLIREGWHKYLARAYCLAKESQQREGKNKITQEQLFNLGKKLQLVEGVSEMFDRLKECVRAILPEIDLEFYLISGGFVDIARTTSIAPNFKKMWGCELAYDGNGEIEFLKQQMTHTEKTRYLYYLSKGIDTENEKDLIYNYRDIPVEKLHVPLNQVVYVGDGTSDIPCFSVMNQYGGIAIGIYKQDSTSRQWQHRDLVTQSQQVTNLVPADYREQSELMRSLVLAVECIGKHIALLKLSTGE